LIAPSYDVRPRHGPEFFRPGDAGETDKIADRVFVDAARVGVAEIGEPLDLGRHVGEAMKLGGGEQPVGRGDRGRKLVNGHGGYPGDVVGRVAT
jgi:hypothetical protein